MGGLSMVTIDKIQRGLTRYIEEQLINKMHGLDAWLGGLPLMYVANLPNIVKELAKHPLFALSGAIAEDGTVNIDKLAACLKPGARKNPAEISLPFTGTKLAMTEQDIDLIVNYIRQA
jgi:hypothetical protein